MPETLKERKEHEPSIPKWFNSNGKKLRVENFCDEDVSLELSSESTQVEIRYLELGRWLIDWEIFNEIGNTIGMLIFDTEHLGKAFGLIDSEIGNNEWLSHHEADYGEPNKWIRKDNFLNILCPGTGQNDDLDMSIYLNEKIKDCVRLLIEIAQQKAD